MIRVENLVKRFRNIHALNDVSAAFVKGEVTSLIGPNGSGKTTLLKSILSMVHPDSGKIFFDGKSIKGDEKYKARLGYMPQIGRFPDNIKVRQLIRMIRDIRGSNPSIDNELYETFDIGSIGEKTMQSLSGGTRQKVSATLAFMFNPEVLILDEPTAGLDPVSSEILKEKIVREKKRGKLILITSHILSDLEDLTTNVVYLQDGKIQLSDSLENIRQYTGEARLGKAIAQLMKQGFKNDLLADKMSAAQ